MRYKSNGFVGMHLWEEKAVIEYIVKAYVLHEDLTEPQLFLLAKSLRIVTDNQEFTQTTLNQLLDFFYLTLHFEPIEFQEHPEKGFLWGGWYDFTTKDRNLTAKRLSNRKKKRRQHIDEVWYREYNESFDWESMRDPEKTRENTKELMKRDLGAERVKDITDGRDPRSAVIVPFKK